jgi:hypothetical protein
VKSKSTIAYRSRLLFGVVFIGVTMFLLMPSLRGGSRGEWTASHSSSKWELLDVRIIARGSAATSGDGTMDSYLAIVSRRKHREETTARLVHYYPSYEAGIPNERILSGHVLRLRLSAETYCAMAAGDFAVQQVFDADALARARDRGDQSRLPCFLVRH